jgi:DNA-directed RNA polymerase specialized sigma subunit
LRRRVRNFELTRETKLFDFAKRGLHLDLIRAAFTRANDPCVAAGLEAIERAQEAIEHPDVAARFAETVEEKDARARALGERLMDSARYAHTARAARTPEEELGAREERDEMVRAAEAVSEGAGRLLVLLHEEEMGWKEAAAQLGISIRQAQRIEAKVLARLRALGFGRR